jgi:UDP-N-acetylglucosamine 2-epimerase (non-hydrolysing)
VVLVTAHRRENLGKPLENICEAIKELHDKYKDLVFIYPVHLNPVVQETAHSILDNLERVRLIDPVDVEDLHNLMSQCYLVMTDSGGLQEEAPAFGVPVLVLRTETERPEAVDAGTVIVVGVEKKNIVNEASSLLTNTKKYETMSEAINPYGDGTASSRITELLLNYSLSHRDFHKV